MSSESISIEDVRAVARAYAEVAISCATDESTRPMIAAYRAGDMARACELAAPFAEAYRARRGDVDTDSHKVCRAAFAIRAVSEVLNERERPDVIGATMFARHSAVVAVSLRDLKRCDINAYTKRTADVEASKHVAAEKVAAFLRGSYA